MNSHPIPFEKLIDFASEETNGDEFAKISSHVASCVECATTVERFRKVRAILSADATFVPSGETIARAKAIFSEPRQVSRNWQPAVLSLRVFKFVTATVLVFCLLFGGLSVAVAFQDVPADSPLFPLKVTLQKVQSTVVEMFAPSQTAPATPTPTIAPSTTPSATSVQELGSPSVLSPLMDTSTERSTVEPDQAHTPAASESHTPPGQVQTPPGQVQTPPGQVQTPPGQVQTPPGQDKEPPGQNNQPPGQNNVPPGQSSQPPGQDKEPPGQNNQPPGQNKVPPGQNNQPPGQNNVPPGQNNQPPGQNNVPPGQNNQPPGHNK